MEFSQVVRRSVVAGMLLLAAGCAPSGGSSGGGGGQAGCALSNISFEKYGQLVSGSAIADAETVIGCAHQVDSVNGALTTARWVLSGAPNVYIEGEFHETTGLGSQSIMGINFETGRPYCTQAPSWPDCVP